MGKTTTKKAEPKKRTVLTAEQRIEKAEADLAALRQKVSDKAKAQQAKAEEKLAAAKARAAKAEAAVDEATAEVERLKALAGDESGEDTES